MNRMGICLSIVIGVGLMAVFLGVLESQSLQAAAPVAAKPLTTASDADWDGLSIGVPMVITNTSTGEYWMWYQGRGLTWSSYGFGLGFAESPDGVTWEKYAGNPVLTEGDLGEWDSYYRGQIALIEDGGVYKMWFSGGLANGAWQTGYATSSDGIDWEIYAGNPVLAVGAPGSWDEIEADGPTVIKDGSVYKLWYHGCNADYSVCSIGYASSNDGVNWSKYAGNPVLESAPGVWDEATLGWPRVIKNGSTYQMWYHCNGKLGYATSPDGIVWTKHAANPVLSEGWDGAGISVSTILLEGDTYKMWTTSGSTSLGSRGIGYFESPDGIVWTQPASNPVLVQGAGGVIVDATYDADRVRARTLGNTAVTITVSDSQGVKASITGVTDGGGMYRSLDHEEDWIPSQPDILPGDTVTAVTPDYATSIDTIGEIEAQAHNDTDIVDGVIHAPWFAPDTLAVLCELWADMDLDILDQDVPADGGQFQCDYSGIADISGGASGFAGYLEPDGDMVSVYFTAPYMEVFYGKHDGVGGIYAPGHTIAITVTNSTGDIKATAQVATTEDGGWWGHGFTPTWAGGDCCDWSPAEPDIQYGDWVYYQSNDGYQNQVQVGAIFGAVDVGADSVTGPIFALWENQTLEVWCHPQTMWPGIYRDSSAEPDGSIPYFCEWQTSIPDLDPWDVQPDDEVMVHYREADGDQVYRMMIAAEGAAQPALYLPAITREAVSGPR